MDLQSLVNELVAHARPFVGIGKVADYIPALARVDPQQLGIALALNDGTMYFAGDANVRFSIQSVSKVFTLALVLAHDGEGLWRRVGREPSGNPFNSLVQLEYEKGLPRNPFINAGAMIITDRLLSMTADPSAKLLEFLATEANDREVRIDPVVAASEDQAGHRNRALAHFLAAHQRLENPVERVLSHYFNHCSIEMTCCGLAQAGLFLARHGLLRDTSRLFTLSEAKRMNAVLLTCGTYDAAGDIAYRIGLPCKSGVGGGVLAIIPGRGAICAWSPGLDHHGNSVAAIEALDRFTTRTGWSIF
jgi:glutaminase